MKSDRRKLLKAITLGGGAVTAWKVPADWSRPVVESVTLPAHAQTTDEDNGPGLPNILTTGGILFTDDTSGFRIPEALDSLARPAYAQVPGFQFSLCLRVDRTARTFDAFVIVNNDSSFPSYRDTELAVGGGDHTLPFDGDCAASASIGSALFPAAHANSLGITVNVLDYDNDGATLAVGIESANWSGFLAWNEFSCGLDCDSLQLPIAVPSDRGIKDNFQSVDEDEILERVSRMPVEYWTYTDREQGVRHIGPMAQDFHEAFNVGDSDRHIHMVDANGVNLASIKALYKRLQEKDEKIAALEADLKAIKEKLGLPS